jgi:hypothetical protein
MIGLYKGAIDMYISYRATAQISTAVKYIHVERKPLPWSAAFIFHHHYLPFICIFKRDTDTIALNRNWRYIDRLTATVTDVNKTWFQAWVNTTKTTSPAQHRG